MEFNNNIQIGDRFYQGKHHEAVVVDIVKTFSTARNEWNPTPIYLARLTNGIATNTFDVPKATIVRNRINKA